MKERYAKVFVALSLATAFVSIAGLVAVQRALSNRVDSRDVAASAARSYQTATALEALPARGTERTHATPLEGRERDRPARADAVSSPPITPRASAGELVPYPGAQQVVSSQGSGGPASPERVSGPLRECPSSMQLVGSVVNVAAPAQSMAAVHLRGGTRVARPGARLGEYELISLGRRRAYLRASDGSLCELRSASTQQSVVAASTRAPPANASASSSPPAGPSAEELKNGVRQLDQHTFVVSRSVLEKALRSPALLRSAGRFRAAKPGGPKGLALVRVSKGSVLSSLGLQKGDVLQKLNGHDLSSTDGALLALRSAQAEGRISVELSRRGAAQALTYISN